MGRPRPLRAAPQAEGSSRAGGSCRKAGPGLLLALPFKIRPRVEVTLGIQQACPEGVVSGGCFGAAAPHTPSPLGQGSQDQSLCIPSHLPPPQTYPWRWGAGVCVQDWVEHGQGHGGGKEGTGGEEGRLC